MSVEMSEGAKNLVLNNSFDQIYGARPVRRYIEHEIETSLAIKMLEGELKEGDRVVVDAQDDKFIFSKRG